MSKSISFKPFVPHLIAVIIFLIATLVYFKPVMQGKVIQQGDIQNFKGMSKEIFDFREKNGSEPLWTAAAFCGMPAYQISILYKANITQYVDKALSLGIPRPVNLVFLYFLGFYILLMCLKIDPWLGILGALAFGFSSYFFIIIEAGHNSKAHAIAYMAPILGGIILAYRGKFLLGAAITALFMAMELKANHFQITYYLSFIVISYGLFKGWELIRAKQRELFIKASVAIIIAVMLAVGSNITNIWATYEYGKYTTRGKSELTSDQENKTSGLDRDYATAWSYGIGESLTLLVPNFKGGPSGAIGNDHKDALKDVDKNIRDSIAGVDQYWGDQPFTSGPVYAGALACFLCLLSLVFLSGPLKWSLISVTVLALMLSWGKNFMWLTDIFLDYYPGYNKFRAVSMILVIVEFTIPLLAILALDKILSNREKFIAQIKKYYIVWGSTLGLCLIFLLAPGFVTDFLKPGEYESMYDQLDKSVGPAIKQGQLPADFIDNFIESIQEVRRNIFNSDVIRSLIFILLGGGVLLLFAKTKTDRKWITGGLALLILIDMVSVDRRYVNEDNFVRQNKTEQVFKPTYADQQILTDPDPNFRVFNTTVRLDQDSRTSYFHKSLGGYHGAKLKRYQEMIDHYLGRGEQHIVNMLNTKYFIIRGQDGNVTARKNPGAMGNGWLVDDVKWVENADEEMAALKDFDPKQTAVIDKRFESQVSESSDVNSKGSVQLIEYQPNYLKYEVSAEGNAYAVFSEVYYDKGWNAYLNGEKRPHQRVNYILRGTGIPVGKHIVEFKFEPQVYSIGEMVSFASSLLLIALCGFAVFKGVKREG